MPPEQVFQTPYDTITLTTTKMQASLVVEPGTALTLDRLTLTGETVKAVSDLGWQLSAKAVQFATKQDKTRVNAHEIGLQLVDLVPDPALMAALEGQGSLPAVIDLARLDMRVELSGPIDRNAGRTPPQVTGLLIKDGLIRWGNLVFFAKGRTGARMRRAGPRGGLICVWKTGAMPWPRPRP